MNNIRIPLEKMTCWELCCVIEREVKELGTDDNTPIAEMAMEEQHVLLGLLADIRRAKHALSVFAGQRDENDGALHNEDCECAACEANRAKFNAWCDNAEARWAEARKAGKVAHVHICDGDCGPLADCGDERDNSLDRVRELREYLHEALS